MKEDKLIIGGHEFNSRFILGSGKYSMKLIESAIKDAGAEIITWPSAVQIQRKRKIFSISSRRELLSCQIQAARGTPRRPCA